MKFKEIDLSSLLPDKSNPNRHTKRGLELLQKSIRENGVGRSLVVDKNNRLICGNATFEVLKKLGITKTIVVETTGDEVVCVKRTDLDLEKDLKARNLSIADNQTNAIDLNFDPAILERLAFQFDYDFQNEWDISLFSASQNDYTENEDDDIEASFNDDFDENDEENDDENENMPFEINDLAPASKDDFHKTVECYFVVPKHFYGLFVEKVLRPLLNDLDFNIEELKPHQKTHLTSWMLFCFLFYKHIIASKKVTYIRKFFPNTWVPLFVPLESLDQILTFQENCKDFWKLANDNLLDFLENVAKCQKTST